jgi:large repetitive protein
LPRRNTTSDSEGATYTRDIAVKWNISAAVAPDGETLTYSVSGTLASGLSFDPSTRTFSAALDWLGSASLTFCAHDAGGTVCVSPLLIALAPAPVWGTSTITLPAATFQAAYSATVQAATAPDGETLTYSVVGGSMPPGLAFNPSTRQVSGTPNFTGTRTFILQAADNGGNPTVTVSVTAS